MEMVLFLLVVPATMEILDGLSFSVLERNLITILLASPSTGGEVNFILRAWSRKPEISLREERGWMYAENRIPSLHFLICRDILEADVT